MKRRVNLFQAAMLRWRALYPYNAVHALRMPQALEAGRLEAAIRDHLQACQLTGLELDAAGQRYEWTGGPASVALRIVSANGDALGVLQGEMERELNAGFAASGSADPFRFFAVGADGSFILGLAYDHYVASGDSIVALLRGIVDRYLGSRGQDVAGRLRRYGPSYARLLGRQAGPIIRGLPALAGIAAGCRRSFRLRYGDAQEGRNAVALARIESADRARLEARADEWGMTTHDLLLAILFKALSPLTLQRRQEAQRNEIAVATIVNIRDDMGERSRGGLAPCLASFRVAHRVPDDVGLRDLASSVREQTSAIKRSKRYLQTLLALGIAGLEWDFMSVAQRQRYFPKHFPLCAGTTPLNVDVLWRRGREGAGGTVPDYIRIVPTGPLAPMILAFTMAAGVINLGISFRTTVFARDSVDGVAAAIIDSIRTL
jgi:hypothetical protein